MYVRACELMVFPFCPTRGETPRGREEQGGGTSLRHLFMEQPRVADFLENEVELVTPLPLTGLGSSRMSEDDEW